MGVFVAAGFMLIVTFILRENSKELSCPTDPKLAAACVKSKNVSSIIYYSSVLIFFTGGFFAFLAPLIF